MFSRKRCPRGPRGVNAEKGNGIVKKLGSIIPAEKLKFWIEMPKTEESADLTINLDK